jgi:carbon storage regulator
MLVLSRKKDERIVIGDNISLCVVEIRGDKVRLGIEAPPEITVHRQEVYDAIQAERAAPCADALAEEEDGTPTPNP